MTRALMREVRKRRPSGRVFNGKVYHESSAFRTKTEAKAWAKRLRERGAKGARVVKGKGSVGWGNNWVVYVRRR